MGTTNSPIPRPAPTCVRGERKPLPRKRGRGWGEGALLLLLSLAAHAAPPNPPSLHTTWFAPRAAAFYPEANAKTPVFSIFHHIMYPYTQPSHNKRFVRVPPPTSHFSKSLKTPAAAPKPTQ